MITTMAVIAVMLFLGIGVILGAGAFYSDEPLPLENEKPRPLATIPAQGFFIQNWALDTSRAVGDVQAQVPIELLMSQLEEHIRLEEAVALEYVREPSEARLHATTSARFLN